MDIKKYGQKVLDYIDNLSDEEFDQMLIRAGIENCPFEDEVDPFGDNIEPWIASATVQRTSVYMQKKHTYNDNKYSSPKYKRIGLLVA